MSIYLATGSADIELAEHWIRRLREHGHYITYDWPANVRKVGDANPREATEDERSMWSDSNLRGARSAMTFWLLVPSKPSIGCWFEMGYAAAWRVAPRIVVSGDWRGTIFTSIADHRFDTHEEAFDFLNTL